ncbi:MAG: ABC transporter ATP-binding protein [Bacteroidaceae bacterium]|nr:ABC transporter ATP-binding protein [Bacteroidaceae bacterium]
MIDFKGVHKTYPGAEPLHVLKGIDLHIDEGELVSIMGASGSGKSTMLNIMGILDSYDDGEYHLAGQLIKGQSRMEQSRLRNELIGYIFQRYNLISFKNAMENVALPLYYRGVNMRTRNRMAMEYLERVGLASHWDHLPNQLSGGQQQRVAIARALAMRPKIILADEPTGALDSVTTQEVMNLLKALNSEERLTMVIVTHEASISEQTHRRVRLSDGRITDDERL